MCCKELIITDELLLSMLKGGRCRELLNFKALRAWEVIVQILHPNAYMQAAE